ncbi:RHS repeat domain-containing protein [Streptomyces sp. NPDC015144]|uniref:RHS repeat domain-containing protein n=1 Tax=Streptomyces sp. NPDC015144 TaxID=3364944 RepID=UPI0036FFCD6D
MKTATRSKTVSVYLQGMDGDKQKDGTTRAVTVSALAAPALGIPDIKDTDQYAGQLRQSVTYDGATAISATMNVPWSKETARQTVPSAGDHVARYVRTAESTNYTYLTVPKTWRSTSTTSSFDDYGMTRTTTDLGDTSASGDETCTRYWYARNDALGLTGLVSRTRTVAKPCTTTETALGLPANSDTRGDVLSDTATVYDTADATSWSPDQKPTKGSITWKGRATGYPAAATGGERNPTGWQRTAATTYDTLGRPRTVTDAQNHVSDTAYTPVDSGPLTKTVLTNAKTHKVVSFLDPRRGLPERTYDANSNKTEQAYDALGRLSEVWAPNRTRGSQSPNSTFAYHLSRTKPSSVATSTLKGDGETYNTSYTIYDALLRPLQAQSPTPLGGQLLTDTRYDSRGMAYETYADIYDKTSTPQGVYTRAEYGEAPTQNETVFDGAGRATENTLYIFGVKKWSTTTAYTGDSTATTAVRGGSATRTITDPRGRVVETREYAGQKPDDAGFGGTLGVPYTSTSTEYTPDGLKKLITSAQDGSRWSYTYDLFGRQVGEEDPDMGRSSTDYDNLDHPVKVTDSRGESVLTSYDELGRVKSTWASEKTDANLLTSREYDTVAKGQPTSSTRYVGGLGGDQYTRSVTAYDSLGRATGTLLRLPESDPLVKAGVPATLEFASEYRIDGTLRSSTEPAVGGLTKESVERKYNGLGLTTSLSGTTGYLQSVDYSALGQGQQLVLGTGGTGSRTATITNTYEEGTGRLTNSRVTDQTHPYVLQDLAYAQDDAGNMLSISDGATLGGTGKADHQCFAYDAHRRLTEAWTPNTADCADSGRTTANIGGAAPYWTSYTYTASGQRDTETSHATSVSPSTTETHYEYGTESGQPHPLSKTTGARAGAYSYDETGNTTKRPGTQATQTLVWDSEGKLSSAAEPAVGSKPALKTGYLYDADGELLIRRAADDGDTILYLGATEVRLTVKGATKSLSGTRYYSAAGQTVAVRTATSTGAGATLSYLVADHHGTSSLAIDAVTQEVTKRYSTPFGAPRGEKPTPDWPDDKAFLGKPADTTTGLTHIGAREYDTGTGQFISVDPVLSVDQHQSLNGYTYANQSPATNSDPTGLACYGGNHSASCNPTGQGGPPPGCYAGNMSASCESVGGNNMGTSYGGSVKGGNSGASAATAIPGAFGSGLTYIAGPKPIPVCFACMIGIAPVVGPVSPETRTNVYCAYAPLENMCNPEDAVLGGGDEGFREMAAKWLAGALEPGGKYGEDSEIAREIMMTDETAKQREIISSSFYSTGITEGTLSKSISNDGIAGQIKKDVKPLVTGDHNLATVGLGSYTTEYKILRASPQGVQVRMTIRNKMTISSFMRPAVGYRTDREKFVHRWFDGGVVGFGRPRSMGVTFRTMIYRHGYRGLGD